MSLLNECLEQVFDERKNFIVIGLTGRTGSGCSTTANLLAKTFLELNPKKPKQSDFSTNDERNYAIIYNYCKKNWKPFTIIKVRSIISTFLLENPFSDFIGFINSIDVEKISFDKSRCVSELSKLQVNFEDLHKERLQIKDRIEKDETELIKDDIYTFFFEKIEPFTLQIKRVLENNTKNLYTFLWQIFGDNIRLSGNVFNNKHVPENIFKMSQRINLYIKILRKRNKSSKEGVRVVIDAFRNPFESLFFKDRYSSFYLYAITTNEKSRISRLVDMGFSKPEIESIDKKEYPKQKVKTEYFSSQDIQRCIELSDVYIHNNSGSLSDMNQLSIQLMRYVSLIMHPGLICPTNIERCMQIAFNAKANSGCISRQVGATVTDNNFSVISIGWNDVPGSQVSCSLRDIRNLIDNNDIRAFSEFEKSKPFKDYIIEKITPILPKLEDTYCRFCFKDAYNGIMDDKNQVHTRSLHAEENAFLQLIKHGQALQKDGYLFTTASPCELCSKKAFQLGIKKIFFIDPYPGISESHVLGSGNNRPHLEYFQGAIGRAYTQLYQDFLPIKDENEIIYTLKLKTTSPKST